MPTVLSTEQIDEFIQTGVIRLRDGFSAEVAARCRERLWAASGVAADAPATWTRPVVHLQQIFGDGPFAEIANPRLGGALDDLLGAGRYHPPTHYGWWPISFPGFDRPPWGLPDTGWHVDGQQFHHHIDSPDQGLLPLFIFSEIQPGDGGTALVPGSHTVTARILLEAEPGGLDVGELARRVNATADKTRAIEGTGAPGDILLLHPFILHARSPNTGSRVRFICNPCVGMKERLRLDPHRDRTPLERSIMKALDQSVA